MTDAGYYESTEFRAFVRSEVTAQRTALGLPLKLEDPVIVDFVKRQVAASRRRASQQQSSLQQAS